MILHLVNRGELAMDLVNKLIRTSYDFIAGTTAEADLERLVGECLPEGQLETYLETCRAAVAKARPV